jgi:hypothetical protein
MEDWLGLTFRPLLARFVANYSKEQVSLSFLKGKGAMRDVILNVAEVNALPVVQASPVRVASCVCLLCVCLVRVCRMCLCRTGSTNQMGNRSTPHVPPQIL